MIKHHLLSGRYTAAAFAVVLLLLTPTLMRAQGVSTIVGTVRDPSGAVVPGVTVKATDENTGLSREVTANSQGYYVIPSLRPSTYELSVQAQGFADYLQKGVTLLADQSATVNLSLRLQQAQEVVTVESGVTQVNTTTSTLSEVVNQKQIQDLPLNGRNAATLTLLVPGAVSAPSGGAEQGIYKTFPGAVTISTNGSRQNQTSYRLDGGNNNDSYTNVNQPFPNPDALQEFSVQTSNYSAKYGGNSGAVVNVITKSGTNEFHGSAFEFVRNAVFNARNFFASRRDQLKRNQFGGTLGGPIVRNRTFFFVAYQGTRIRNVQGGLSAFVPTNANLQGDFSALLNASNPANPLGRVVQIIDPTTGQPFPGNIIPTSRFDPAAVAFTRLLPRVGGNGLVSYSQAIRQDFNEILSRVDHSFSDKDRVNVRFFYDRFDNAPYLDQNNYLSAVAGSRIDSYNFLVNETHVFNPNLLSDLRLSYVRVRSLADPPPGAVNVNDLGLNIYQPPGPKTLDGIKVSGFFNLSLFPPSIFMRHHYNVSEDISWVKGRHSIAFGGSIERGQVLIRNGFLASGTFSFTPDFTNYALASFLLGRMRSFRQGSGEFKDNWNTFGGLYFQDDFHATPRLTLNFGLRWEPFLPWKETRGRIEQFRPNDYYAGRRSQVFVNAPPGLFFPGDPGVPERGARPVFTNFSPRVGFAYDVFGDGKTSIRGGAGIFYDANQIGILNNRFVNVTPFSPQLTVTDPVGPFSNPYLGLVNPYPAPFPPPRDAVFPTPVLAVTYDPADNGRMDPPVIYNWNLSIERQVGANWLARVAYVGSHSSHLTETIELNPARFIPGSTLGTDQRRIFQPYGSIAQSSQDINANYNSLQLTARRRFSRGLMLLANYTWSKSIDTLPFGHGQAGIASQNVSPIPWYLPGRHQFDTGPSEFDRKHNFVLSYTWELPKVKQAHGALSQFINGWQLNGIFTAQSGLPRTILAGSDRSRTGLGTDRVDLVSPQVYGPGACGNVAPCVDYLNRSAFAVPAVGSFGNLGKGALRGPNYVNWDVGAFKNFVLSERFRLEFRAEFFNVLNRVNLGNPNNNINSGAFGSIRSAGDPRIGQFALKLLF